MALFCIDESKFSCMCILPVIPYRCRCCRISMGVWSSPVKHYWLLLLISVFSHIHLHTYPSYYYLTKNGFCAPMATQLSVKPRPLHASYFKHSWENPHTNYFNKVVLSVEFISGIIMHYELRERLYVIGIYYILGAEINRLLDQSWDPLIQEGDSYRGTQFNGFVRLCK